ncbi:MAG TPA: sugar ABC transporter ATP-binding protein [Feifaniaceae bacterium]|nr:sugar ABC transporter ATP-binding protein [Feifaniaceae bacterium]
MSAYLEMRDIVKRFPGVLALDRVNLSVNSGEVHVLLGENGAGKSTLMKILSGAYEKDQGDILLGGRAVEIRSSRQAQELKISTIYQELNLIPQLTVAENIFLGRPIMKNGVQADWKRMYEEAQRILDGLGVAISSRKYVRDLGIAHMQMVEVAKALSINSRVLIMDEPTAPLTAKEIKTLFSTMRRLKGDGVAIIYISHRLEEVLEIGDRATILRDGKNVTVVDTASTDIDTLIRHMVGRELKEKFPKVKVPLGEELFRVEHLCAGKQVQDVSFSVRAGELYGIAGLVGAGRTETARAIFGMDRKTSGSVYVAGKPCAIRRPLDAIRAGIGFATEDRKSEGLTLTMNVGENITLASLNQFGSGLKLSLRRERKAVAGYVEKLNIKTPSLLQKARNLSGGNQQKVVLAKWLLSRSRVFLFDEPTRGIDVGAKIEVYNIMTELVSNGAAVVLISSELPELLGMCDRIAVMCQGRIGGILENGRDTVSQELILQYATGGARSGQPAPQAI